MRKANSKTTLICVVVCTSLTMAGEYELRRQTLDGGGVMNAVGGGFELSGTIGQFDASSVRTGDAFELTGGFWFRRSAGDCDDDGAVSLWDFGDLNECFTGPGGSAGEAPCPCLDLDGDGDVDLVDFARFQSAFGS